jgi:hypothetical protein
MRVIQLEFEPEGSFVDVHVDMLLSNSEYHEHALRRRVLRKLPACDRALAVLSCEDLILHKLLAGRLIDLADGVALMKANRPTLDFAYLDQWAARIGVVEELRRVRREAAD